MLADVSAMVADPAVACVTGTGLVAAVGAVECAPVADAAGERSAAGVVEMLDLSGTVVGSTAENEDGSVARLRASRLLRLRWSQQ